MRFLLTEEEIRDVEFIVDGRPYALQPVSMTTPNTIDVFRNDRGESIDLIDFTENHDDNESGNTFEQTILGYSDSEADETDHEANESDLNSDASEIGEMSEEGGETEVQTNDQPKEDGPATEQFILHYDTENVTTFFGQYEHGRRCGVWKDEQTLDGDIRLMRSLDFDVWTAKFKVGDGEHGDTYTGGFVCRDSSVIFIGDWACDNDRIECAWSSTKPYIKIAINRKHDTIKRIARPDLTVLKQKQWHKNGTLSFSKDLGGWMKLKDGETISGIWVPYTILSGRSVRISNTEAFDYMLQTSDEKYYNKAGYRLYVK